LLILTLRVVKARERDMLAVRGCEVKRRFEVAVADRPSVWDDARGKGHERSVLDVGNVTGLSACLKSGGGVCGGADNMLHPKLKAEGSYRGAANGDLPLSRIWRWRLCDLPG
jgi:hypothetical protein